MRSAKGVHVGIGNRDSQGHYGGNQQSPRRAVGYVRVSTDMQAAEGMSLEAQQAAIEGYCAIHGIKLVKLCQDVMSGGKDVRPGLADALRTLQGSADVLIVLKFDRLSRSIKHFCELYETYFKDGTKELVAIRESIRLDSSLGRALVGILLVCAQMEREAIGERTREAIGHIKRSGYHVGKVPYGKRTIPAPDHPRMKILIDNEDEQKVIEQILKWSESGIGISEIARKLNEQGWIPRKGKQFTERGIHGLLRTIQATKVLSPRGYLEMMLTKMERAHDAEHPTVPFARPTLEEMGRLLEEVGYVTPRGHEKWWPAQVAHVQEGRLDGYYSEGRPEEIWEGEELDVLEVTEEPSAR